LSDDVKNKSLCNSGASEHVNRWCALPAPYPEPRVVRPNQYYAMLLLEDYAGAVSEMTAINQYFYHYLTFEEKHDDIAELEECVSIIEMYHLELLGKTIRLLGVAPEYRTITNNRVIYWNASFVYYGQGICDRLAADIAAERMAIQNYRQHQQLIGDPYIKELLERIIMDEQHHLQLFTNYMQKYCPGMK